MIPRNRMMPHLGGLATLVVASMAMPAIARLTARSRPDRSPEPTDAGPMSRQVRRAQARQAAKRQAPKRAGMRG